MSFLDFGDDPEEIEPQFDECPGCKFFGKTRVCNSCEMGEYFIEADPEGIDSIFRD